MNFQSVMDNPERVRRVTPPSTTMLNTQPARSNRHQAIAVRATAAADGDTSEEDGRRCLFPFTLSKAYVPHLQCLQATMLWPCVLSHSDQPLVGALPLLPAECGQ